jgi:hypothetical protein
MAYNYVNHVRNCRHAYRFSYLRTKDDAEIDLIVDRPGLPSMQCRLH